MVNEAAQKSQQSMFRVDSEYNNSLKHPLKRVHTQNIYLLSSGPKRSLSRDKLIQSDPQSEVVYRVVILFSF